MLVMIDPCTAPVAGDKEEDISAMDDATKAEERAAAQSFFAAMRTSKKMC